MANDRDEFDYYIRRKGSLEKERSSFITHYMELSEFVQPRRGRFNPTDRNRGERAHQSIINSRASRAHRIARAGMFAGVMSPARPWFKMETEDKDMLRFSPVKQWLYDLELRMRSLFFKSNLYNMAPTLFGETILFATGAMSHVNDPFTTARFYTHTAGSYLIGQDDTRRVNTFVREYQMTAEQMISMFGIESVSVAVRNAWDTKNVDEWFTVVQFIEDNPNFNPNALTSGKNKPIRSVYFEPSQRQGKFLRMSGFDEFPVYVPRWEVTGEDIYGTNCPGMESLGDIKGMQIMERRKGQAVDIMLRPPMGGPPSLKNIPVASLPGGVTTYDATNTHTLKPLYQIDPRFGEIRLDINAIEQRINENFFVDLFLAISSMQGIQPKNQLELSQRNEERLLQLGPVLEQFHGEFLVPLIARTFNQMVRTNQIPIPPPELQNQPLQVNFVSMLALAQRSVEVATIERFAGFVGNVSSVYPEARDKVDTNELVDQYATLTGVIPSIVRDNQTVQAIQQQRAEAQAAALQAEQAQKLAQAGQSAAGAAKLATEAQAQGG